jgi:hypothetical protein
LLAESMKVSDVNSSKVIGNTRRKKKSEAKRDGFANHLSKAVPEREEASALDTSAAQAVDSILTVQEVPDATEERSRRPVIQHGDELLDRLDQLRHDLLVGAVPKDKLAELAHRVRAGNKKSDDPKLKEIIDEIELRAEVEIAKLTREI